MTLTFLNRLPTALPEAQALPELLFAFESGGQLYAPHLSGVTVDRDPIGIEYNVTPRQTARGRSWNSGSGKPKNVSVTVRLYLEAPTPLEARRLAQRWRRIVLACEALYEGARAVYPTGTITCPEADLKGCTATLTATIPLHDPKWRLSPDDVRPTDHPVEATPGNYPLGLLEVTGEGSGYYDVAPLGGVNTSPGAPLTLTNWAGQSFTFKTYAVEVTDDE